MATTKLYPPSIGGTIPAFYTSEEKGTVLTVPFSMNKAVNKSSIDGFRLKIKTVQSGTYIDDLPATSYDINSKYEAYFTVTNLTKLKAGSYYKVQLAYTSNGEPGYYSTVGVVKYTTAPNVYIANLNTGTVNTHKYSYTGYYSQKNGDTTEKEYSYQFIIYDSSNNIVADSGVQLHNNEEDVGYDSLDTWEFLSDLEINESYYIIYKVKTINDLEVSSPRYKIKQKQTIDADIQATLTAEMHFDNGYVTVALVGDTDEKGYEYPTSGKYVLTRACEDSDYKEWDELLKFTLQNQYPSRTLLRDFTVKQGKTYIYAVQQYNSANLFSNRILSNEVFVNFEDMFLYDGERQLKLRFNPKVTSFKTDYLETKVDTIGSKYPFIFRNGNVEYKEFPISGLVSYWMDDENLFMLDKGIEDFSTMTRSATPRYDNKYPDDNYFYNKVSWGGSSSVWDKIEDGYKKYVKDEAKIDSGKGKTTALTGFNIASERDFKLTVLDWLNNGKPKLFRSPAEGNYIVRLMNISMSPEDKLNRMLHTVTGTAYEIADCSYSSLSDYGMLAVDDVTITDTTSHWTTVNLAEREVLEEIWDDDSESYQQVYSGNILYKTGEILEHSYATSISFNDMIPGSVIEVLYRDKSLQKIMIGATGTYSIPSDIEIISIKIPDGAQYTGSISYSYYDDIEEGSFSEISDVNYTEIPAQQFIGCQENILDLIQNIKTNFIKFYYLRAAVRPIEDYDESNKNMDTLPLYKYYKNIYTINNKEARGMRQVDISERDFPFGTYYIKSGVSYLRANKYDSGTIYYEVSPFEFYYDSVNPGLTIVSEDTYNQLSEFVINAFEDNDLTLLKNIVKYSNKLYINDNEIDITEKQEYSIKGPFVCDSLYIGSGIVLNCGYELQEIDYIIEGTDERTIKAKQKYENIANILSVATMKQECLPYGDDDTPDQEYTDKLIEAREVYLEYYNDYIETLTRAKKSQEGNK